MKTVILLALLLCVVCSANGQKATRTIAVTIDDLPYVGMGDAPYLSSAQTATAKILSTLKKYKAPTVAFVNERKVQTGNDREAITALLRDWVHNGVVLGNHTYSHPDFNRLTVEQFEEEILKGELVTRKLMSSRRPYQLYFRHPMTHTGDTVEKKEAIEKFLAARGYKVTPHTIENSDYIFNVPYSLAMQKGDTALAKRVRDAYLDLTFAATDFAEKMSPQLFGREIPQILLIHSNDLNADVLDEILRRYAERGYTFVSLDKVMSDPAYQTKDTYISKWGPTWFFRWSRSKGMDLDFSGDPDPPKWVMDLYNGR